MDELKRCLSVLSVVASVAACGTSARIHTRSGEVVRGHIRGGTPDSLVLEEGRLELPRREIRRIRHPGGAAAGIGAAVLTYGVFNIAIGAPNCSELMDYGDQQATAFCAGVFLPAVLGAGMVIWGLAVNNGSKMRALDQSLEARVPPGPRTTPGAAGGLTMDGRSLAAPVAPSTSPPAPSANVIELEDEPPAGPIELEEEVTAPSPSASP